ncbi:MAG TPA: plastocyanin/azurin family copper-binding protein [Solirubrobacteraceae bacterium]
MRTLKRIGLAAAAAAAGGATVGLPAIASSETAPTVTTENVGVNHYWTPSAVTVPHGGTVQFNNPGEVPHGIRWVSTPAGAPECSAGVPVGTTAAGTKWSGTCTFAAAGTYSYYCTVHGAAMSGTITVANEPSWTTTSYGSPATTTSPAPAIETTTDNAGANAPVAAGKSPDGMIEDLKLRSLRNGTLTGSLRVQTAVGGRELAVTIRARLGGRSVIIGKLSRPSPQPGIQRWTVKLNARARRALAARHALRLTVRVALTAPGAAPQTATRELQARR